MVPFLQVILHHKADEKNGDGCCCKNVKNWSRKVPESDIFNLSKFFFPVNDADCHWGLAVAFMEEKRIQCFDSMHEKDRGIKCLHGLLSHLEDEH